MVCSSGSGRMQVMAKLLASTTFSQNLPDEFAPQKFTAEYICRELCEADETNFLDGEDMQVYGERPMTDMLQLVCCNVCKKPIKDSQYAAHSELCRSLMLLEPTSLELNCSTGNRKSARKSKKKLSTSCANQATAVEERRRSDTKDNIGTVVLKSHLSGQIRVTSSSIKAKGHSTFVDAALMMDDTGIIPGNRDHPASIMHRPTESHIVITSTHLSLPESCGTKSGVTKFEDFANGITWNDWLEGTVLEHGCPNHKNIGPVHVQHATNNDYPAPLATKIYYSQRNNRLRAAIRHLYFQELSDHMCNDAVSPNASHGGMLAFQGPCQKNPSFDQIDNVINKPGPREHLLHCFIKRNRCAQTYYLYLSLTNSLADDGKFLLAARKCRRPTSTDYMISFNADDMSKGSNTIVGKLRSNFLGTKFTIYDAQPSHSRAMISKSRSSRPENLKQVSPKVPTGNYIAAHISYDLNVLGSRGPRRMHCALDSIPASAIGPGGIAPTQTDLSHENIDTFCSSPFSQLELNSVNNSISGALGERKDDVLVLKNKSPRWHEQLQCWCLNFDGRVTIASVKNFQLVASPENGPAGPEHDEIILQFGKVGKDMFTMDFRYPISAFQAFAICLSSFDTKIACE